MEKESLQFGTSTGAEVTSFASQRTVAGLCDYICDIHWQALGNFNPFLAFRIIWKYEYWSEEIKKEEIWKNKATSVTHLYSCWWSGYILQLWITHRGWCSELFRTEGSWRYVHVWTGKGWIMKPHTHNLHKSLILYCFSWKTRFGFHFILQHINIIYEAGLTGLRGLNNKRQLKVSGFIQFRLSRTDAKSGSRFGNRCAAELISWS